MARFEQQDPIYYDPGENPYEPPSDGVSYRYGTHRWRFGSFSDTRGWPTAGVVWNERLVLAKGTTLYGSVTGDLNNHARYNERGEISNDMAFIATVSDPNGILALVGDEKLKVLTGSGMFVLGPSNAASGVGPSNLRVDRQNSEGGAAGVMPIDLDGRTIYVGKARNRVIQGDYDLQRNRQGSTDLTRYARHIGAPRFVTLASTKDPARLLWSCMADGTLRAATLVPEEDVLGWSRRSMAEGASARSIAAIPDTNGQLDELWVAAEFGGAWHVVQMAPPRQEGDAEDPPYLDLAAEYRGAPAATFGPIAWLKGRNCQVWADGAPYRSVTLDADGRFTLPSPATHVWVGLAYPAEFTTLGVTPEDTAFGKKQRISRVLIDVMGARGLQVEATGGQPRDVEQLNASSLTDSGYTADEGIRQFEDMGDWTRVAQVTVRRVAPVGATVRAVQPTIEVSSR